MNEFKKEAVLWKPLEDGQVRCNLCNFRCTIADGAQGACQVRANEGGVLYSLNYHKVCSTAVDPIEKKPLFHFQPGSRSLSVACPGCNFRCDFCQNWQISQLPRLHEKLIGRSHTPQEVVLAARQNHCRSISYTYTEPTVFMELCAECGRLARRQHLANVFVSNGFMTIEAIEYARDFLDAINIDLKAFTEQFYQKHCRARLAPVLETLRHVARRTEIWLEVTTLVIPGRNDSDQELRQMAEFIANELGPDVPWHLSRFHPDYQLDEPAPTPPATLERACQFARQAGLRHVYVGNLPGSGYEDTICPDCGHLLVERRGYRIGRYQILNGACPACGAKVVGRGLDPVS
ncbi:MAG: AmmeMemoRadiSam system radical SAM enzyme [Sedimentisphaerales bacterium]|nr:AmmeMemoRadiSam system radical SAM enzyme [Sedimentisphaerales bacterium]